jgi:hypothetical protein
VPGRRLSGRAAAGEGSLRDPVTLALGQKGLVPLATDLELDGRVEEHVDGL